MEHTRLGIPLFLAEEAPHGHMAIGTTVFPTGLGLAATFDREVARKVGSVIAQEVRLQGAHISYGRSLTSAANRAGAVLRRTWGKIPCSPEAWQQQRLKA